MTNLCAYGRNGFHFHSASSPLRQPNVTLTGRAAGYNSVILATGLQGQRPGEAESDGKMRRVKDRVAGEVPVFSPLNLWPLARKPGSLISGIVDLVSFFSPYSIFFSFQFVTIFKNIEPRCSHFKSPSVYFVALYMYLHVNR